MPILKKPSEIEIMAEAGGKLARILCLLRGEVRVGMQGEKLETQAKKLIRSAGALPAFLGYRPSPDAKPYPFALCVSLNEVVVHGCPTRRMFRQGDIVKLDLGLRYKGYYVDSAITVGIEPVGNAARMLIETTRVALERGISMARVGKKMGDIGYAIERHVRGKKCSIVESLTGHGIGRDLHEEPPVWNRGEPRKGIVLEEGMVLAIEPMVSLGTGKVREQADGGFAVTDGSPTAHFEHTVAITAKGPRVLTISPA